MLSIVLYSLQAITIPLFEYLPTEWEAVTFRHNNGERSIAAHMSNLEDTASLTFYCDRTSDGRKLKLLFNAKNEPEFDDSPIEVLISRQDGHSRSYLLEKQSKNSAALSDNANEVYNMTKILSLGFAGIEVRVKYKDGKSKNISFNNDISRDTPFGVAVFCNLGLN